MANHNQMSIPALGRSFHLGTLYDMRSDTLIPGVTLWDPENLEAHKHIKPQPYTDFEIITNDTLEEKARALGVQGSMKLSLIGGLLKLEGSAKYADDYRKTSAQTRLTLKYKTTTRQEELTMKHLAKGNLNHPNLHDANIATHVVTGILYGADAYFVFDRTFSKTSSEQDIGGKFQAAFKKIPKISIKGEASLNLTNQEDDFFDQFNCKFYGDFRPDKNPTSFSDAVDVYHKLPTLLGKNNEYAVPKNVWLYPLHLLDNKSMRIVREISSNLIDDSIAIMENLRSFEILTSDLLNDPIFKYFDHLKQQLKDFRERLIEFQRDLKQKVALYLPKLRGSSGIEESVLFDFFKRVDSSPFNQNRLKQWLEDKKHEITIIKTWINDFINDDNSLNVLVGSSYSATATIKYVYIFDLSFHFFEKNDSQLIDMENYRNNMSNIKLSNIRPDQTKWYEDSQLIAKVRKNVREFIEFAKGNNNANAKIKFIIHEKYSTDQKKFAKLTLYDDDGKPRDNFIIPSKPSNISRKFVTENSITIQWQDAMNGSSKVVQYKISYRATIDETLGDDNENNKKSEKLIEVYTDDNKKEIFIPNMLSNTPFIFKVQSVTTDGLLSPFSDDSKPIRTLPSRKPNTALALKQPPNNLKVLENQDAQMTFELEDSSRYNITLLFSGSPLELSNKYSIKTKIQINFNISKTKTNDSGTYTAIIQNGFDKLSIPVRVLVRSNDSFYPHQLKPNLKWNPDAKTVAGGNERGDKLNQLYFPEGIYVDNQENEIYIADHKSHRIVKWKIGEKVGQIIAGGNGVGDSIDQLTKPTSVIVDKDNESLIICDHGNRRVVRWSLVNKEDKQIIIDDIKCHGLMMNANGDLFVSDQERQAVRKWRKGEKQGIVVAGGNGHGSQYNQLNAPKFFYIDRQDTVYISDWFNHRVMKWVKGAIEGIVVAGGQGKGNSLKQIAYPEGLIVDEVGNVYVADSDNYRIMCWPLGSKEGRLVLGGNGKGKGPNQFEYFRGLSFDRENNLYVVDWGNHRVQRFDVKKN